jgi:uncharacterized protein YxjI
MSTELTRGVESVSVATQSQYVIKRKFWSILERKFRVLTLDGQLIMFVKHPLFKWREEFVFTADEAETQPIFILKAQQAIAINFNYVITDAKTGEFVASIQKRGLKSIIRDKFLIHDAAGEEIGYMEEQGASILRRIFPFLTSKHAVVIRGQQVGFVRQKFRFFNKEFGVEVTPGATDPRFVLACALLAVMAEARREDAR